jgi:hypothetical protein
MSALYDPSVSIFHPAPVNLSGNTLTGAGAPNNSLGFNGQYYFDTTNLILYFKNGDVWNVVSGSTTVTGGGGTLEGVVDPEGVTTAVGGTMYWNSALKKLWVKNTAASGNTGWELIV